MLLVIPNNEGRNRTSWFWPISGLRSCWLVPNVKNSVESNLVGSTKWEIEKESFGKRTFYLYTKPLTYAQLIVTKKFGHTCFSSLQKRIWHKLAFASFLFIKKVLANTFFSFTQNLWHTHSWSLQKNFGHTRYSSLQKRIWHKLTFASFFTAIRDTQTKLSFEKLTKEKIWFWKMTEMQFLSISVWNLFSRIFQCFIWKS